MRVQSLGPSTSVARTTTGAAMAAVSSMARRRAAFVFMRHLVSSGRVTGRDAGVPGVGVGERAWGGVLRLPPSDRPDRPPGGDPTFGAATGRAGERGRAARPGRFGGRAGDRPGDARGLRTGPAEVGRAHV